MARRYRSHSALHGGFFGIPVWVIGLAAAGGIGAWFLLRAKRPDGSPSLPAPDQVLDPSVKAIREVGAVPIASTQEFIDVYGPIDVYTVQTGDTLKSLSKRFYSGSLSMMFYLFDVNRTMNTFTDPEILNVGAKLLVPKKYPNSKFYSSRYGNFALWASGRRGERPADVVVFSPIALEGQKLNERR